MKLVLALFVSLLALRAGTLRGTITDPSGAVVPGAAIELRGPGGTHRGKTGSDGTYAFPALAPGKYQLRVNARGFAAVQRSALEVRESSVVDVQLAIRGEAHVINVEDEIGRLSAEPQANGGAVVMRERQIAALSDDPDELALQLQALAGPAPGPNGGQIFVDGFSGGVLPPKSAIREIRINANPFSPEYDRPGFARVEIFTKPGSESLRGQAFAQYAGDALNTRNPLLTQSSRPPYDAKLYGFDLSGPIQRGKASFTLGLDHRRIGDNAFILATTLDANRNPVRISQAAPAPQARTNLTPRLDVAINPKNTLALRYQGLWTALDGQGVGDFNLPSRSYDEDQTGQTIQLTHTATFSARAINETRFQFARSTVSNSGADPFPAINVLGAFSGGGAPIGNSGSMNKGWEATNTSRLTRGTHAIQWGTRVRQAWIDDTSVNNFAGSYTFFTLALYQRTLELQQAGYSGAQIAAMGAGPSQFSLSAGAPVTAVSQSDAGLFFNEDWRTRPNLTVSLGMRYEAQSNHGGRTDWAPRAGIAWGLGGRANRPAKTVLRAGAGIFFDRIPLQSTLAERRYDGATQQSYLILNPDFFPAIPPPAALGANRQPQQLRPVSSTIRAGRLFQTSLGIERQLAANARVTVNWVSSRGTRLANLRNVNTPIGGAFPFGDASMRLLTESAGYSRQNQLVVNANATRRKLVLFSNYALSYGRANNEGLPADPYNLRAEWSPSSYGDVRHRFVLGATLPAPGKISLSPFFVANSGIPYNITTGLDPNQTGYPTARPALVSGACQGANLIYAPGFGCFDLRPAAGTPSIARNYGRGPAAVNLALRISRTWTFGPEVTAPTQTSGGNSHGGETRGGKTLTLSAFTLNAPNHPNYGPPSGDLSSPYFGQYRSLGGMMVMQHGGAPSTFNRKIDLQVRVTF